MEEPNKEIEYRRDNFVLSVNKDDQVYLNTETFMPLKKIDMRLSILMEAQHDGRLWDEKYVRMEENELVEQIMNKLRKEVTELVLKTDPFSIHAY